MQSLLISLVFLIMARDGQGSSSSSSSNLRGRKLQNALPYFQVDDPAVLGEFNREAASGNPLKGLLGGVRWSRAPLPEKVPLSMEWANFGLDEIMVGDNQFDWELLDSYIEGSASRNRHLIFSVYIHWPGKPLRLPPHLLDIDIRPTNNEKGPSPYYGDERLLTALRQFIYALGERYDGDKRIATIHLGLLGFWGEFHTFPWEYVPDSAKHSVVTWFSEAFKKTQLQARYPRDDATSMGLYDGSFAYHTLDGEPNGGVERGWYFWPQIKSKGQENSWRTNLMGGETRPQIQKIVFTDEYPVGTENHQDFKLCAKTTHMSFVLHHDAFQNGGYASGKLLDRALDAHTYLGYNFRVSKVAAYVSSTTGDKIDLVVTIVNEGIAPFYYDCGLQLQCDGLSAPLKVDGVNNLIDQGESDEFVLSGVPATRECLQSIQLQLTSSYAYEQKPIKWAQGNGKIVMSLPGPGDDGVILPPVAPPISPPVKPPTPSTPVTTPNTAEILINAGSGSVDLPFISGDFRQAQRNVPIAAAGAYDQTFFRTHRYGKDFTYTLADLTPGAIKKVTLGFAEAHMPTCSTGQRIMNIFVNGEVFASNLDVFSEAGCQTAFLLSREFAVDPEGKLTIHFMTVVENAMVSVIQIDEAGSSGGSSKPLESQEEVEDEDETQEEDPTNLKDEEEGTARTNVSQGGNDDGGGAEDESPVEPSLMERFFQFLVWLFGLFGVN